MRELGWIEGQNVDFDIRATSGDYAKLDTEAGSLVAASADVIVAKGTPASPLQKNKPRPYRSFSPKFPILLVSD